MKVAAVLLGIGIAIFSVVAGIVHVNVLTSRDAFAAANAPAPMLASSVVAVASTPSFSTIEWSSADSSQPVLDDTDASRECNPSAGIDSACIYN